MFKSSRSEAYFPTIVWRFEMKDEEREKINNAVLNVIERLTGTSPKLMPGEQWQSDQDLHELEELSCLIEHINFATADVLDYLSVIFNSFTITGCWANYNHVGTRHAAHTHPNNYLSGVYYVKTGKGSDQFFIEDPRPQTGIMEPAVTERSGANMSTHALKVSSGALILFPAWLSHFVDYNTSTEERISISFNIMFEDFSNTISKPKWTGNLRTGAPKNQ